MDNEDTETGKSKKRLSREVKNSIRLMVEGGSTLAATAKEFGVSIATVQRYAKSSRVKAEPTEKNHSGNLRQQSEAFVDSLRNEVAAYEQKALTAKEAADAVEKELQKII